MNATLTKLWESIRTSYWFVPMLLSLLAAGLSALCLWLDVRYSEFIPDDAWWIYGGGPEGARELLAAIVGSMITVTSIVFSITIVALTLAAGQFGTRLLRTFMRDTSNQVVLGTFVATFIYSILIMGRVRGLDDAEFVPHLSITVAIVLVLASVGVLIYFIHHASTSIQADTVITSVSKDVDKAIERLYPESVGGTPPQDSEDGMAYIPPDFEKRARAIRAPRSDYLEVVEDQRLLKLTREHDLVAQLTPRPGMFLIEGSVVMKAWPAERVDDELAERLLDTLMLNPTRSITQDIEFGFLELVEIATRALSTGINDPFSAITCVDRLSAALTKLARRPMPSPYRFDDEGNLRLIVNTPTFSDFVSAAFNQIRENTGSSPTVLLHMMEAIGYIAENTQHAAHLAVLREHAEMMRETGMRQFTDEHDRAGLDRRFRTAKTHLSSEVGAEA